MRRLFYSLAGITAALFGWNITLLFVDLIGFSLKTISQNQISSNLELTLFNLEQTLLPEIILFPLVSSFLSVSLVLTAVYLSNPTHQKANKRRRNDYFRIALITGFVTGLISAIITITIYQPTWTSGMIRRVVAWGIIGLGIGLAEGFCWRRLTTEGANTFSKDRLIKSPIFCFLAGLIAAFSIEIIKEITEIGGYEEPLGFAILGMFVGLSLSISTTPAYQVALRAGRGFGINDSRHNSSSQYPKIIYREKDDSALTFAPFFERETRKKLDLIEEGLSIQLPRINPSPIVIGSAEGSDILLPGIPGKAAELILKEQQWIIKSFTKNKVQIQTKQLEDSETKILYHNQILTFYYEKDDSKYYRFIFYDRFLDPST